MLLAEQDRLKEYLRTAPAMLVLAVQDTTDVDLTGSRTSNKLGSLNYAKRKGYYVHNHLLLNSSGVALGLFDQQMWNRDSTYFGQDRALWPLQDKESYRWYEQFNRLQDFFADLPQHTVLDICDREGDFFEMLQARRLANVHLLVRSNKDKKLTNEEKLWATLAAQSEHHAYQTQITDDKGEKHKLSFQVKYCPVQIPPNYRMSRDQPEQSRPVGLYAVSVEQTSPLQPWQKKPIIWRLLTSLTIQDFEQAMQVVEFYILRWRIEVFHYVLKQGCAIEAKQFKEARSVENAITFYSLLAWKVLNLRYGATSFSSAPIEEFGFSKKDFFILATFLNTKKGAKIDLKQPCPDIGQFAQYIKRLVTAARTKRPPGVKSLWTGLQKLQILREAFEAFT